MGGVKKEERRRKKGGREARVCNFITFSGALRLD